MPLKGNISKSDYKVQIGIPKKSEIRIDPDKSFFVFCFPPLLLKSRC